ncbi:3-deoxy-manno-octulosonate cytidylyltransferase [Alteromonas sp. ASW11-36]|uniref:3-deoxy-manno-octulosonate cytidylyltransferase n=1 Tax=Alteromonas arenosi TaxID=3055817 RepID=A0ABT7SWU1_9ALTE|nr:3-deoxy-manno-octulosonate cytidylyltransferase [Alteromonas sp. ASW11-36]MDM7860665.1 3-deoxy-manno-octulosonate cytidylyltransferase [Alteromonas sp. ASW11-36]
MINTPDYVVVIPARYASSRFPGKPLALIQGLPMIQHVYQRAIEAQAARAVVATDDKRIAEVVEGFGGEVCFTRADHQSGTERIAEVVATLGLDNRQIVVNVQGDEPFIPAENIRQVALNLAQRESFAMATLATPLDEVTDVNNPNAVKVVTDKQGKALYFSRATIPFDRDGHANQDMRRTMSTMLRHIGIYAYRAEYILRYVAYEPSALEMIESLEQLRALYYGDDIHVERAMAPPPVGIDTPEDLARLNAQLK